MQLDLFNDGQAAYQEDLLSSPQTFTESLISEPEMMMHPGRESSFKLNSPFECPPDYERAQ